MAARPTRGRPRKFDKEEVLQKILKEFWIKGFAATSLDDLSAATGLTRPSLYAAYGNKTQMYLAALQSFVGQMSDNAMPALSGADDLQSALEGFYQGALNVYFGARKQALGCLVFTTAIADVASDTQIKKAVSGFVEGLDGALTQCISSYAPALEAGHAQSLAQLASGMLMNLATRARAGETRDTLDELTATSATFIAQAVDASSGKKKA
ncbi:TetR/AcrR family transcriptional regulator [Pyruvatibacter sp.]|uniref:TetR/AcrR family transcriptional regulator n=1 Tax=Pyruvatibacter sp. TaxID=1981328 RepID=UPI0032649C74